MSRKKPEQPKIWLNNKFKEGYGEYLINRKFRVFYSWEIGTFSFKDRFTILTPSWKFVHLDMSGSRSWNDELEFIGELKSIKKIADF
ncbi:MAG: hypothetical protein HC846_00220 [Blastocatellia bacterium]|nr:hypothetical protein [Blastocatellia bacterium]